MHAFRLSTLAAAALAASVCVSTAYAGTVFETAAYVNQEPDELAGGYFIDSSTYIGASFHLSSATTISGIGGNFTQYSDTSIFGAIVSLDPVTGMPNDLLSNSLGHVVFAPSLSGGDQTAALPLKLAAGDYGVVFGSGLWGATGYSGFVGGQGGLGTNEFASYDGGASWSSWSNPDEIRLTVTAVPEPSEWAMMLAGLGLAGTVIRRRRAK
jgi:hypothetical protein